MEEIKTMKCRTKATISIIIFIWTMTTLLIISLCAEKEIVYKDCFDKVGNKIIGVTCEDEDFVNDKLNIVCIILVLLMAISVITSLAFMLNSWGEQ